MTNILSQTTYNELALDIVDLVKSAKNEADKVVQKQLVLAYWQIGKRINQETLESNSNYFFLILDDLSKETKIDKSTLVRTVKFYKAYPKGLSDNALSWSHYKSLISLTSKDLRIDLEKKAKKQNWTKNQLIEVIKNKNESNKQNLNNHVKRPIDPNYLYKAKIANVIDGDTLLLNIDLGFQVIKEQRIRLAQINAAEFKTPQGQKAFKYLRDLSANLETIVIKTNKIDIYGRFIADIFYPLKQENNQTTQAEIFENGIHLNEELVAKGFAEVYS